MQKKTGTCMPLFRALGSYSCRRDLGSALQSTEESLEALRGDLRSMRATMDADAASLQLQVTHLRAAIGSEVAHLASSQVCSECTTETGPTLPRTTSALWVAPVCGTSSARDHTAACFYQKETDPTHAPDNLSSSCCSVARVWHY